MFFGLKGRFYFPAQIQPRRKAKTKLLRTAGNLPEIKSKTTNGNTKFRRRDRLVLFVPLCLLVLFCV